MSELKSNTAKKILIVDDEADTRHSLKESLKNIGNYKVLVAKSGNMGTWFATCSWHKPDLIILDLMMSGVDGFEVLRRVKQNKETSDIPVVILTGRCDEESRTRAQGLGCDDYIVKPVELKDLLSRIEKALTSHKTAT